MTLKNISRKRIAITPIFATIILLGITATLAGVLYYTFSEQIDPFLTSSNIEVRNLNVVESNGRLTLTATIKNSGQGSIDGIFIEDIAVGNLRISQDINGRIIASEGSDRRFFCLDDDCVSVSSGDKKLTLNPSGTPKTIADEVLTNDVKGFAVADKDGNNAMGDNRNVDSSVPGGGTKVFKLSLKNDESRGSSNVPNIKAINPSEKLTLSLRFVIDDNTVISDVYTTRVKQG